MVQITGACILHSCSMSKALSPPSSKKPRTSGGGHSEQGQPGGSQDRRVVFSCQSGEGRCIREQFGCSDRMEHYALLAGVADGQPTALVAKGSENLQWLAQLVREQQIVPDVVAIASGIQSASPMLRAALRNVDRKFPLMFEFTTFSKLQRDRTKQPSYVITEVRSLWGGGYDCSCTAL